MWSNDARIALTVLGLMAAAIAPPLAADSSFSPWSAPVNLGPVVNSPAADQGPAISPDGLALYFTSNRPGGRGGEDLWVARREHKDDPWGAPFNIGAPINGPFNERVPAFSRDGRTLFFASNRPGGFGERDIWMSQREDRDDDFAWGPPVNLGPNVNTLADEAGMALFEKRVDDEGDAVLIFNSTRPGGAGDQDMYVSVREEDGSFGLPTPIVELNTPVVDARPTIRRDGREIFFFRGVFPGPFDLFVATRESRRDPWSTPENLGPVVNSPASDLQPSLSRDARTLFFASNRAGGSGGLDLWTTTREKGEGH